MAALLTPRTWVDSEIPDYATLNADVRANLQWFITGRPMVKLVQTTQQTLATSTFVTLNWQFEEIDTEGIHSATDASKIIPKTTGLYKGWVGGSWTGNSAGQRLMQVLKNGANVPGGRWDFPPHDSAAATMVVKGMPFQIRMNGTTDYLQVQLWQSSGSSLTTIVTTVQEQPEIFLRWYRR